MGVHNLGVVCSPHTVYVKFAVSLVRVYKNDQIITHLGIAMFAMASQIVTSLSYMQYLLKVHYYVTCAPSACSLFVHADYSHSSALIYIKEEHNITNITMVGAPLYK